MLGSGLRLEQAIVGLKESTGYCASRRLVMLDGRTIYGMAVCKIAVQLVKDARISWSS